MRMCFLKFPLILHFLSSEFTLDEAGDIRWKLHQTPSDYLPFLTCDSYELAPCPNCKVIIIILFCYIISIYCYHLSDW